MHRFFYEVAYAKHWREEHLAHLDSTHATGENRLQIADVSGTPWYLSAPKGLSTEASFMRAPTIPPVAAPAAAPTAVEASQPAATTGPRPGMANRPSPVSKPAAPPKPAPIPAPVPAPSAPIGCYAQGKGSRKIDVVSYKDEGVPEQSHRYRLPLLTRGAARRNPAIPALGHC